MRHIKGSRLILFIFFALAVGACKKDDAPKPAPIVEENPYIGSKDGPYVRNFIGMQGTKIVPIRAYIKYAADKPPLDTTKWDEVKNSVYAAGLGQHVRFDSLNFGTYYVLIKNDSAAAEVIMVIDQWAYPTLDVYLPLK